MAPSLLDAALRRFGGSGCMRQGAAALGSWPSICGDGQTGRMGSAGRAGPTTARACRRLVLAPAGAVDAMRCKRRLVPGRAACMRGLSCGRARRRSTTRACAGGRGCGVAEDTGTRRRGRQAQRQHAQGGVAPPPGCHRLCQRVAGRGGARCHGGQAGRRAGYGGRGPGGGRRKTMSQGDAAPSGAGEMQRLSWPRGRACGLLTKLGFPRGSPTARVAETATGGRRNSACGTGAVRARYAGDGGGARRVAGRAGVAAGGRAGLSGCCKTPSVCRGRAASDGLALCCDGTVAAGGTVAECATMAHHGA